MRTVSRAGLRKEPWIKHGKEELTLFRSRMHSPVMRREQFLCKEREESLQVPWSPGQEVWKNKTTPLGQPTRQEKDSGPTKGTTDGGKKEAT